MKILITIPCLLTGGTEIQTLNLVRALVEGGHEVTTACFFEHSDDMIGLYEQAGSKVVVFSEEGVRVGDIACVRFLWKHLLKLKRTLKPDAVHVQYMAPGAIPIILLWLMGQRNILATVHTNADIYGSRALILLNFLQKRVLRAFTCITTNAERAFFGEAHVFDVESTDKQLPKHSHFTIYNSLPGYIQIAEDVKPLKGVITIGVVSRLEKIKGMDMVVPAFKRVYMKHRNVRLLVVGDGNIRQQMEQEASMIGEVVTFVGRQRQDTLQYYYDQIDILLMPSRSEGFGLTAIEGMARGCVVVASNTGGLPEVVKDGGVGLLHQTESVDDLAEKIGVLVENEGGLMQMKALLRAHVSQFMFEKYSQSLQNLYKRLENSI